MAEDFIPNSTINYINKAKKDITKSLVGSLVKKYANEIDDGVKAGLSSKQIADNLRKKDSSIKSKTIANTIARTLLHGAYARGSITDMLEDEMIVAFRFNAVNDSRVSDICESLDGKIISKDEVYNFLPPLHYNCRSVLEPIFINENIPEDKLINKNTYKTKEYQEKIEPLMKKQEAFLKYQKEDIESIVNETQQVIKEPEVPKVVEVIDNTNEKLMQNIDSIAAAWSDSDNRKPFKNVVGYRYGKAPESGKSWNYAENKPEAGVSLASAFGRDENKGFATMEAKASRKPYYYTGDVIDYGSDGEFILGNIKEITKKEYDTQVKSENNLMANLTTLYIDLDWNKRQLNKSINIVKERFSFKPEDLDLDTNVNIYKNRVELLQKQFDTLFKKLSESSVIKKLQPEVKVTIETNNIVEVPKAQEISPEQKQLNDTILKFNIRLQGDNLAVDRTKVTSADVEILKQLKPKIVEELKNRNKIEMEAVALEKQQIKQIQEDIKQDKTPIKLEWREGSILNGFTVPLNIQPLFKELNIGSEIGGWGYLIPNADIEKLGETFSYSALKEYADLKKLPERMAEEKRKQKEQDLFRQAKENNKPILIDRKMLSVYAPKEDKSFDIKYIFAMPDGTIKEFVNYIPEEYK